MIEFIINDNGPMQSWQTRSDCGARSDEDVFSFSVGGCVEVQEDVISMR